MLHRTEHASKVSTRSVNPYPVRILGKSYIDRHTDRHRLIVQNHFLDVLKVVHPKSSLISNSIFSTMPILPCDMEVIVTATEKKKTGPEEAQYFHVRPPIGFI